MATCNYFGICYNPSYIFNNNNEVLFMTETKRTLLRNLRSSVFNPLGRSHYDILKFMRYSNITNTTKDDILDYCDNEDILECFNLMDSVMREVRLKYMNLISTDLSNEEFRLEKDRRHRKLVPFKYKLITANCTDYEIRQCDDCSDYMHEYDAIFIEGANLDIFVCSNCLDASYRYHDNDGMYYHVDDYPYDDDEDYYDEEEDEEGFGRYAYDYNVLDTLPNKVSLPSDTDDEMLLGYEGEWEARNGVSLRDVVADIHHTMRDFALVKYDGSLRNGGEIVTAPSTLKAQKYYWSKFCESKLDFTGRIKAWHTETCGTHIHVGRKFVTPLDIGKLLVFINGEHNRDFIHKIAGRSSSQWAKQSDKHIKNGLHRSDKYEALNLGKPHTIEFRIFRGNLKKFGIFRNLEFVHALVRFAKQSAYDIDTTSVSNLTYENFVDWVGLQSNRAIYPYLYKWLVKNDYVKGKARINTINESEVNECA